MKTKLILLPILLLFFATQLLGQTKGEKANSIFFTFGIDAMFTDFNKLTPDNFADPYPVLQNNIYNLSYQIGWRFDRMNVELGVFFGENETATLDNQNTSRYRHFGSSFAVGFNVLGEQSRNKGWLLAPEFVTSLQAARVALSNRSSVNSILDLPAAEVFKFTQFSSPLDVGLQFNKQLFSKKEPTQYWIIGLRAGYRIDDDSDWELDSALPVDFFPISSSGPYASFRIGHSF